MCRAPPRSLFEDSDSEPNLGQPVPQRPLAMPTAEEEELQRGAQRINNLSNDERYLLVMMRESDERRPRPFVPGQPGVEYLGVVFSDHQDFCYDDSRECHCFVCRIVENRLTDHHHREQRGLCASPHECEACASVVGLFEGMFWRILAVIMGYDELQTYAQLIPQEQ